MPDFSKVLADERQAAAALSPRQEAAVEAALDGRSIFLSGPGGVGKSFVTMEIVRRLRARGQKVAVTASTGVAAVAVGGTTLHSFLGLGIAANVDQARKQMGQDTIMKVQKRIGSARTIVCDEISMITGDHLDMAHWWLNLVEERGPGRQKPFGGFQIIMVGDGLQLPPVVMPEEEHRLKRKFFFQADVWDKADLHECYLTESFRQSDAEMVFHLNRLRRGVVKDDTVEFFRPCVGRELDEPTRLFPTNREVSGLNMRRLDETPGASWMRQATYDGNERWFEALQRNCIAEPSLELKVGVPVIIVKNNWDLGYVNGQRGKVLAFDGDGMEGFVSVELTDGRVVQVVPETWEIKNADNRILASMHQYPLKLAWALSIHKSQGMSLERVQVDLSNTFERAMGYVALSRAKSTEGLSLDVPISQSNIRASKVCVDFYKDLAQRQAARESA